MSSANRRITEAVQMLEDYEAVKAFRRRPGRPVPLAEVKKRLGSDRRQRRR